MTALRVPHIIRPNRSGASPQAWVIFDVITTAEQVEERKWKHEFRFAVATYWRQRRVSKEEVMETRRFADRLQFISWLTTRVKSKERLGVISHGIDFDAQVLDIHCALRQLEWRPTRIILEKGRYQQRWRKGLDKEHDGNRALHFIDLQNFYPTTLRQVGKWISLPKSEVPNESDSDTDWTY